MGPVRRMALLASVVVACVAPARAGETQRVVLHAFFVDVVPQRVSAVVQQAGTRREVRLVDDGSDPADAAGDRVWTGSVEGNPAQYLPITLAVQSGDVTREAWTGTVHGGLESRVEVALEVAPSAEGALQARRRATAAPGAMAHAAEAMPFVAVTGWALVLLGFAAATLRGRSPPKPSGDDVPDEPE